CPGTGPRRRASFGENGPTNLIGARPPGAANGRPRHPRPLCYIVPAFSGSNHSRGSTHAAKPSCYPASFRAVAVLRKNPPDLRPQADRLAVVAHFPDHAEARPDAVDRRLSPYAGHADRRRHLLRHAMHHARARAEICRAFAVSRAKSWDRLGVRDVDG